MLYAPSLLAIFSSLFWHFNNFCFFLKLSYLKPPFYVFEVLKFQGAFFSILIYYLNFEIVILAF